MEKYLTAFQAQLSQMKTGQITPGQMENIKVKFGKGETQPLKILGNIIVKSPRQIVVAAYEKSVYSSDLILEHQSDRTSVIR